MQTYLARISEICLDVNQEPCVWVECEPKAIPPAGRYMMAWSPDDADASLSVPIFASEYSQQGFLTASPVPAHWQPGMSLSLTGPCGHGFDVPAGVNRLAIAIFGHTAARLLPVILSKTGRERSIALFANCKLPTMPAEVEINPLDTLPVILNWADFLVCDVPLEFLDKFLAKMKLPEPENKLAIPGQVLVSTEMPCGGVAECGACSILVARSYQFVCKDGPVFDLQELLL